MYTPYLSHIPPAEAPAALHHPQPQLHAPLGQGYPAPGHPHQPQYPQQYPQAQPGYGAPAGAPFGLFSDPASAMAALFARNSLGQSNEYLQQNFGGLIGGDVSHYFKVSNSYVLRKIGIILFPYRHKNWARSAAGDAAATPQGAAPHYLAPTHDLNSPDLYIPLMAFITYILLWASIQGYKGDFHPQVFGYLALQTLACLLLDIGVFKVGLYLLNCLTQALFWDTVAFLGYKYVTVIALLAWKTVVGGGWVQYAAALVLTGNLLLFLMRLLKFWVLPGTTPDMGNGVLGAQRRLRIQFLFVYAVVLQMLLVLFMSR